ncbi:VOC family protein [Microlunatus elymi]|uniref:VOC family protein n=1 Tax=Microlunatus elymi TaxID=2596828 RepID=UPI00143D09DC|nr:VOC family protein [Microlunatus elymi]
MRVDHRVDLYRERHVVSRPDVRVKAQSSERGGEMTTTANDQASVSVMLIVPDTPAAVSWYKTALGAAELWNLGSVAALQLRGAPFMLHESVPGKKTEQSPIEAGLTTTRIEVFVDDPDQLIGLATKAGATDIEPVTGHQAPWGTHQQGGFTDPFGHRWSIGDRSPIRQY